jgi:hypothetical protein
MVSMVKKAEPKGRGGAPEKSPGGLACVLFIRADQDLVDRIDAYVVEQKVAHPGRHISRSDAARELLHTALALA